MPPIKGLGVSQPKDSSVLVPPLAEHCRFETDLCVFASMTGVARELWPRLLPICFRIPEPTRRLLPP